MRPDQGMKCTIRNLKVVHRDGDNYELRVQVTPTHYLHCQLSLNNCRTVRNEMLDWEIDNAVIIENGKYYRVEFLFEAYNIDWTNTNLPFELTFHSEKVNLDTVFSLYDRIVKND